METRLQGRPLVNQLEYRSSVYGLTFFFTFDVNHIIFLVLTFNGEL